MIWFPILQKSGDIYQNGHIAQTQVKNNEH